MEDLWRVQDSGIDVDDLFDNNAEFKRLLERFREGEKQDDRRKILFRTKQQNNH